MMKKTGNIRQPAKVLCFNLPAVQLRQIQKAARAAAAEVVEVPQSDFSQTLGAILGVFPKNNAICFSPFEDKMLIMSAFERPEMERFLEQLKQAQVIIPYKAVVTPVNLMWRCEALVHELKLEHEQIAKMKGNP